MPSNLHWDWNSFKFKFSPNMAGTCFVPIRFVFLAWTKLCVEIYLFYNEIINANGQRETLLIEQRVSKLEKQWKYF